jgi:hypothetical protein
LMSLNLCVPLFPVLSKVTCKSSPHGCWLHFTLFCFISAQSFSFSFDSVSSLMFGGDDDDVST